jgi:hypothetical protein
VELVFKTQNEKFPAKNNIMYRSPGEEIPLDPKVEISRVREELIKEFTLYEIAYRNQNDINIFLMISEIEKRIEDLAYEYQTLAETLRSPT